jgi:hypothetical protein
MGAVHVLCGERNAKLCRMGMQEAPPDAKAQVHAQGLAAGPSQAAKPGAENTIPGTAPTKAMSTTPAQATGAAAAAAAPAVAGQNAGAGARGIPPPPSGPPDGETGRVLLVDFRSRTGAPVEYTVEQLIKDFTPPGGSVQKGSARIFNARVGNGCLQLTFPPSVLLRPCSARQC